MRNVREDEIVRGPAFQMEPERNFLTEQFLKQQVGRGRKDGVKYTDL
jgi:hypothetical protein